MTEILYENCETPLDKYRIASEAIHLTNKEIRKYKSKEDYLDYGMILSTMAVVPLSVFFTPLCLLPYFGGLYYMHKQRLEMQKKISEIKDLRNQLEREQAEFLYQYIKDERSSKSDSAGSSGYNYYNTSHESKSNQQRGTFKHCVTVDDVKRVYREKAKKHHPDRGGDVEKFRILCVQYERALKIARSA